MSKYYCTNPPQTLKLKVGDSFEVYEFPDFEPVEVSPIADFMLEDIEDDDYERVD